MDDRSVLTIANYITYAILLYGLVLCYYRPKTAFLLLLATQFTRISNIMGVARLFSPLFIEFIILLIIYFRIRKQINFLTVAKYTKIFFLWVGSHMGWRLIQYFIYDDFIFIMFSGNLINFYFKVFLFYLILIQFLSTENDFKTLTKYLSFNLMFLVLFVYLEYFFGIEYGLLFNTKEFLGSGHTTRYFQKLVEGPYEHWTVTGMVLVTSLPLFVYRFNDNVSKTIFYILFLLVTIVLVGSRAATVSALFLFFFYLIANLDYKKGFIILLFLVLIPFLIASFAELIEYYKASFSFAASGASPGYSLTMRLLRSIILVKNIPSVPLFGYAYRVRPMDTLNIRDMPFKSTEMESNLFIKDIYDFGIIVGFITIIWVFSNIFVGLKHQKKYNYASTLTWIGLLIAGMSNINFTFPVLMVPLSFYSWEKRKLLQKKLYPIYH